VFPPKEDKKVSVPQSQWNKCPTHRRPSYEVDICRGANPNLLFGSEKKVKVYLQVNWHRFTFHIFTGGDRRGRSVPWPPSTPGIGAQSSLLHNEIHHAARRFISELLVSVSSLLKRKMLMLTTTTTTLGIVSRVNIGQSPRSHVTSSVDVAITCQCARPPYTSNTHSQPIVISAFWSHEGLELWASVLDAFGLGQFNGQLKTLKMFRFRHSYYA